MSEIIDLSYVPSVTRIEGAKHCISPSGASGFFSSTSQWFREFIGQDKGFEGSTASVLGTVVHFYVEAHLKGYSSDTVNLAVARYHNKMLQEIDDLDIGKVKREAMGMAARVLDHLHHKGLVPLLTSEHFSSVCLDEDDQVYVAGSIDLHTSNTIYDIKTTSALNPPKAMPYNYKLQQLIYAWLLKQEGYNITRVVLLYVTCPQINRVSEKTGKPLKDYPTTVSEVVHVVTDEDMLMVDGMMNLICDSIITYDTQPDLRYLIAKDYRLKDQVTLGIESDF